MKNLSALAFLVLVAVAPLRAQAISSTEQVEAPMNGIAFSDCSESAVISGMVHGVFHLTRSAKDQSISIESHVGPRGDMKAVGMDTGRQYNLVGETTTRLFFAQNVLEGYSFVNTFNVVGLFKVHYSYHLLFGDNYDTPKAFVDNIRVDCK